MALRQFATEAVSKLGLRRTAAFSVFGPQSSVQAAVSRAFASSGGGGSVPQDLKYAKSHEWVKVDGDVATVGITDFAQSELGDIVYVELPEVGSEVVKGETFGVVESVKAASDVYSPISGEVTEANGALAEEPGKVNTDAHGSGWMMKVRLSSKSDLDSLMDPDAYTKHIEEVSH